MSDDTPVDVSTLEDPWAELVERAQAAGREILVELVDEGEPWEAYRAKIAFPAGRDTRTIYVRGDSDAKALLANDFESVTFLGDLAAYVNIATGEIEAAVQRDRSTRALRNLPGVEKIETDDDEGDASDDLLSLGQRDPWKLSIKDGSSSAVIEIGSASPLGSALLPSRDTFRVRGVATSSHDETLRVLEELSLRLAFDLDVVFGTPLRLMRRRVIRRRATDENSGRTVSYPKNRYEREALQLYHYGRQSEGLPLLEFLAYYQSVEYFFPYFAREQTVNEMRATLLNPRFDPGDDREITRLINLAAPARVAQTEREQLRTTLRACLISSELEDFLQSDADRLTVLTAKKQEIRGVHPLRIGTGHPDIREQIADRVYIIRCRIVHSKQDGGGYDDVLLPTGNEANALHNEIDVVRYAAQQVLVARAARA